jgi:hypothetical protein
MQIGANLEKTGNLLTFDNYWFKVRYGTVPYEFKMYVKYLPLYVPVL